MLRLHIWVQSLSGGGAIVFRMKMRPELIHAVTSRDKLRRISNYLAAQTGLAMRNAYQAAFG